MRLYLCTDRLRLFFAPTLQCKVIENNVIFLVTTMAKQHRFSESSRFKDCIFRGLLVRYSYRNDIYIYIVFALHKTKYFLFTKIVKKRKYYLPSTEYSRAKLLNE